MKKLTKLFAKHKLAFGGGAAAIAGFVWYRRRQAGGTGTGIQGYVDQSGYTPGQQSSLDYVPGGGPPVDSGTTYPNDNSTNGLLAILASLIKAINKQNQNGGKGGKGGKGGGGKGGGGKGGGGKGSGKGAKKQLGNIGKHIRTHYYVPRSNSHVRPSNGGRTKGANPGKKVTSRNRGSTLTAKPRTRQRATTAAVSHPASHQHPQAATQPAHRAAATPQHRPSQTPTRTTRTSGARSTSSRKK